MIEILVEVGDGPARIRMTARAESIRRAMEAARAHYPGAGPGEWIRGRALVSGAS